MLLTGFEIHGTYRLFGWERAGTLHTTAAWTLIGLWIFAIFWHFTTGEWRQYIPTTRKILDVAAYYSSGIFKGEPHPFEKRPDDRMNPIQKLTYFGILNVLLPLQKWTALPLEAAAAYVTAHLGSPITEDIVVVRDGRYAGMGIVLDLLSPLLVAQGAGGGVSTVPVVSVAVGGASTVPVVSTAGGGVATVSVAAGGRIVAGTSGAGDGD